MTCLHPWDLFSNSCADLLGRTNYHYELTPFLYLWYFSLTYLIELPFYYFACERRAPLVCLIANLATHPLVFLVLVQWANANAIPYGTFIASAEAFAILFEMLIVAIWFRHSRPYRAVVWVAVANFVSWTIGSLL